MQVQITLNIPIETELLLELLETKLQHVLQTFIDDLTTGYNDRQRAVVNYLLYARYGFHCYQPEQLEAIYNELVLLHGQYRQQLERWYKEWFEQKK